MGVIDVWRYAWDANTAYRRGDIVVRPDGSTYLATADPPIGNLPENGNPWVYLAWHSSGIIDVWRGIWTNTRGYQRGDLVVRPNGSTYLALADTTAGDDPPENGDPWVPLDARPMGRTPVLHSDTGNPSPGLGTDGDLYIDASNGRLWTRDNGTWTQTSAVLAVAPSAWTPVPLDPAIVVNGASVAPAYRLNAGRVELRGFVQKADGTNFGITGAFETVTITQAFPLELRPPGNDQWARGALAAQTKNGVDPLVKWELSHNAGTLRVSFPPVATANAGPQWIDLTGVTWAYDTGSVSPTAVPIAQGVTYRALQSGRTDPSDGWRVAVNFPNGSELTQNPEFAQTTVDELIGRGYQAERISFDVPASADLPARPGAAYGARVGKGTLAQAQTLQTQLQSDGYTTRILYSAEDGAPTTGPFTYHIAEIAPAAVARMRTVYGTNVSTSQTVDAMARAAGANVAINGSEFDIRTSSGFPGYEGVPTGILTVAGKLLHAAVNGLTALVLNGSTARITEITTTLTVKAGTATRLLNGINRVPDRILSCGIPGALLSGQPHETPLRNALCTNPDEIIQFTPEWGDNTATPNSTNYAEAVIGPTGTVTALRNNPTTGGSIPAGGYVLAGRNTGADWLRANATVGTAITVTATTTDSAGNTLTGANLWIAGAGHCRILQGGTKRILTGACGIVTSTGEPSYVPAQRQPRTAIGIRPDGTTLLVAMDGRDAETAVGVTYDEAADFMLELGCWDALLVGAGGDVTLSVNGATANHPRDTWLTPANREQAVAVAVLKP